MTKCITSDKWRGERAEPLDPATVRFKARQTEVASCEGCLFERSFGVCSAAAALAMANGQPVCEERAPGGMTYIYVQDQSDPRQLDLIRTIS